MLFGLFFAFSFFFFLPGGAGAFACLARWAGGLRGAPGGAPAGVLGVLGRVLGPLWVRGAGAWVLGGGGRAPHELAAALSHPHRATCWRGATADRAARKLAAALALFAAVDVPLVYKSVDIWRTVHPQTTVVPTLDPRMRPAFWSAFVLMTVVWGLLLALRFRLEAARAELATLKLETEDLLEARS